MRCCSVTSRFAAGGVGSAPPLQAACRSAACAGGDTAGDSTTRGEESRGADAPETGGFEVGRGFGAAASTVHSRRSSCRHHTLACSASTNSGTSVGLGPGCGVGLEFGLGIGIGIGLGLGFGFGIGFGLGLGFDQLRHLCAREAASVHMQRTEGATRL